jgi:hypothetical protein
MEVAPVQSESRHQILITASMYGSGSVVEKSKLFYRYDVEEARPGSPHSRNNGEIGRGNVWGTHADLRAWNEAEAAFTEAIASANRAYLRAVGPRWHSWLPGHHRHVERAKHAYQRATEAAQATYQPVADEISRRKEAAEAEWQQLEEERRRIREKAQADAREREERENALAERAIWGWSAIDSTTVRVFESAEQGLTAAELDEALRALYGSGVRRVGWDPAARNAVAQACALPGTPPSGRDFEHWWHSATRGRWHDPAEIPLPPPPPDSRNHATFHHSDYGSGHYHGGDFGGSYGASHGTSF